MSAKVFIDADLVGAESVALAGPEFHYLIHVRRRGVGDGVVVHGRNGMRREGIIESMADAEAILRLGAVVEGATVWPVDLLCAVPRRNVMDALVRQLNEIGVRRFIPIVTARSVVNPGAHKIERWRRIARESMRQCGRATPLEIAEPIALQESVIAGDWDHRVVAHTGSGVMPFAEVVARERAAKGSMACVCGPEGGFTDEELAELDGAGFRAASLGDSILRVETAAFVCGVLAVGLAGGYGRGFLNEFLELEK